MKITILHVEDDPSLAKLVRVAFQSLGFHGNMLTADRVENALALLAERARHHQPVDLILSDMQLPDGTGLDVVREVRADPYWHLTPVLVLSGEIAPGVVNEAYALGANCCGRRLFQIPSRSTTGLSIWLKRWMRRFLPSALAISSRKVRPRRRPSRNAPPPILMHWPPTSWSGRRSRNFGNGRKHCETEPGELLRRRI